MSETYNRVDEVKAFDEMKVGVKGLVDTGITKIPRIFHHPEVLLANPKPSSTVRIPTIDLKGGMFESEVTRERVVAEVRDATEKFGFFQVINHGIPLDVLEKMIGGIRAFHEQDPEVRKKFHSRDKSKNVKYNTSNDLYDSSAATWRDTLSCFMFPDAPEAEDLPEICRDIMREYSKQVKKVGELAFELLSEGLGLSPNHLHEIDCAKDLSSLYFFKTTLEDLQVLHDGYWIDVRPTPGALIINVGDLLQLISNDKFISVEHRVLAHKVQEPRISVACFFVHPKPGRLYGPIKEILSEQNPPKYRETTTEVSNHYVPRRPGENFSLHHLRI